MTTTRSRKPRTPVEPPPDALVMAPTSRATPTGVEQRFLDLPLDVIHPNPNNPRRDLGDLDGLAASIRALGVLEPLLVELIEEGTEGPRRVVLLAGHRRLAAARLAELTEAPCIVRTSTRGPAERLEMALVENLQREGLAPLDEADGYRSLVELGLSQRAIADRVGCSQSHVSKRLQLLELPSHVQARITKGTLPLEAAAALVRLKDHPDKLKKAAGEDPSNIAYAVERAEATLAWEAKRAELHDVAKGRGWPVVDEPYYYAKRSFKTLSHWNGPPEIEVDVRKHEAEPCHGVMIPGDAPPYAHRPPTATSICTEPARHGPKGASKLKALVGPKARRSEHEVREAKERQERKAAGAARATVIGEALQSYKPARRADAEMTLVLRHVVEYGAWDSSQVAGELLHLEEPPKGGRWAEVVEAYAGRGHLELHRAALALVLASMEVRLRGHYGGFHGFDVAEHYAYLATLGYTPSPFEQGKLDEAAKADRAD